MKSRNIVILILVVLVVVGGVTGYRMWNKPHDTVEDATAIKISAAELCREYADDETKANRKYLSKALEVTGIIGDVSANQDGYTLIVLQGEDASTGVECTMREKDVKPDSGREVTVKGFCSGSVLFGVKLTDCVIAK